MVHALLTSLSTAAPVQVSPTQTMAPADSLAAAIITFLSEQIEQSAIIGQVSKPLQISHISVELAGGEHLLLLIRAKQNVACRICRYPA